MDALVPTPSESIDHQSEKDEAVTESLLIDLKEVEYSTHVSSVKESLHNDVVNAIDTDHDRYVDAVRAPIVDDFFNNFADEWDIDEVSDSMRRQLVSRLQTYGYTRINIDILSQHMHSIIDSDKDPQETFHRALALTVMDLFEQLDVTIYEQFALLMAVQAYEKSLTADEQARKKYLWEQLLAELFEWKNLEIYEIVVDVDGRVVITLVDDQGNKQTLIYDHNDGRVIMAENLVLGDIEPASAERIGELVDQLEDNLPYDPQEIDSSLLQFLEG